MLDARKLKMIETKLAQPTMSNAEIAKIVGVSRQSIWEWSKDAEVKAELDRRLQAINQGANMHLRSQTDKLMDTMLELALSPTTEPRTKNSALQYLLDRSLGKAPGQVDIDLNTNNTVDVLQGFKEFLQETGYLEDDEVQMFKASSDD